MEHPIAKEIDRRVRRRLRETAERVWYRTQQGLVQTVIVIAVIIGHAEIIRVPGLYGETFDDRSVGGLHILARSMSIPPSRNHAIFSELTIKTGLSR